MTVTSAATHYLVKTGKLTGNPKFGSLPKVAFAAYFGFLFGKISYKVSSYRVRTLPGSPRVGLACLYGCDLSTVICSVLVREF